MYSTYSDFSNNQVIVLYSPRRIDEKRTVKAGRNGESNVYVNE